MLHISIIKKNDTTYRMYVYIKLDLQLANGKAKFVLFETIV